MAKKLSSFRISEETKKLLEEIQKLPEYEERSQAFIIEKAIRLYAEKHAPEFLKPKPAPKKKP